MRKPDLVRVLYSIAEALRPLTQSASPTSATWDGTQYVRQGLTKVPDPYALAWRTTLNTMAALIEAQESPLSIKQIAYLKSELLGGMGSLLDVQFDPKTLGESARDINEKLREGTHTLFTILSGDLTED